MCLSGPADMPGRKLVETDSKSYRYLEDALSLE